MNVWIKRGLQVGLCTGGLWLAGTGLASAAPSSPGPDSPISASVKAPISVARHHIALRIEPRARTVSKNGAWSGTPVTAPATVCANSVGDGTAGCADAPPAPTPPVDPPVPPVKAFAPRATRSTAPGTFGGVRADTADQSLVTTPGGLAPTGVDVLVLGALALSLMITGVVMLAGTRQRPQEV
jgi:hypothetical protein